MTIPSDATELLSWLLLLVVALVLGSLHFVTTSTRRHR